MAQTTTRAPVRTHEDVEVPLAGTYRLDPAHSHVGFSVRHAMVSRVRGRFDDFEGTVVIGDEPVSSSAEVEVKTASIDTREAQRDGHLRSPDFFDAETYPKMTYRSTRVVPEGDAWKLEGELTIRDVARPVTVAVTFEGGARDPWGGDRIGFTAHTEIDREEFGLTWNQALETGGILVGKKVRIELEVEAVRDEG